MSQTSTKSYRKQSQIRRVKNAGHKVSPFSENPNPSQSCVSLQLFSTEEPFSFFFFRRLKINFCVQIRNKIYSGFLENYVDLPTTVKGYIDHANFRKFTPGGGRECVYNVTHARHTRTRAFLLFLAYN